MLDIKQNPNKGWIPQSIVKRINGIHVNLSNVEPIESRKTNIEESVWSRLWNQPTVQTLKSTNSSNLSSSIIFFNQCYWLCWVLLGYFHGLRILQEVETSSGSCDVEGISDEEQPISSYISQQQKKLPNVPIFLKRIYSTKKR